jgi:hypothetical protein
VKKKPEPEYNHFDEFCMFVKAQEWMSDSFRFKLIGKLAGAMADAHERGIKEGRRRAALK